MYRRTTEQNKKHSDLLKAAGRWAGSKNPNFGNTITKDEKRQKDNIRQKKWSNKNLEKRREIDRRSYRKDPERSKRNAKKKWLKREYNLSYEQYQLMLDLQNGICACCGNTPNRLVIDHNHQTSKIRGLICDNCNFGIGHFSDSIERLELAIKYLKERN